MKLIIITSVGAFLLIIIFIIFYLRNLKKKSLEYKNLKNKILKINQQYNEILKQIENLNIAKEGIETSITEKKEIESQIENAIEAEKNYYDIYLEKKEELISSIERIKKDSEEEIRRSEEEIYRQVAQDFLISFSELSDTLIQERDTLQEQVNQERISFNSALEIAKHNYQEEKKQLYYMLNLPIEDIEDIKKLKAMKLKSPEVLGKVIWKVYYEKPYTDLIGRLFNGKDICGIYKITNIENGMAYVGQSVNVSERFKQHIKKGIKAESPTQNKLYSAMWDFGPEKFTFELIEECRREKLDEREDYWQDFYKVKEFGYSIK